MAGSEATYPIKITFDSPGACPPVYVAGSFTVREWHPQELNYSVNERKDNKTSEQPSYTFFRTFDVPVGTFQYKFRLGIGDWWVCDSNGEIGRSLGSLELGIFDSIYSHRCSWQSQQPPGRHLGTSGIWAYICGGNTPEYGACFVQS